MRRRRRRPDAVRPCLRRHREPTVELDWVSTSKTSAFTYLEIVLTTAPVSSVQFASSGGSPTIAVTFVYEDIGLTYYSQTSTGSTPYSFCWNELENDDTC